jgi:hypothetical protein
MGATNYRYPSFLKTPSMFSISQPFTLAGFKRNYMVFSYFDGACNFFSFVAHVLFLMGLSTLSV